MTSLVVGDIPATRRDEVVDLLSAAFDGYEAMEYMLGPKAGNANALRKLVGFFTDLRYERGGMVLGVLGGDNELVAAALVDPPGEPDPPAPGALAKLLGAEVVSRVRTFSSAVHPLEPEFGFFYVGMLGVAAAHRGQGHARLAIDHVSEMSAGHVDSRGVLLTTEHQPNLAVYKAMGFQLLGDAVTPDGGLRSWTLFRADD